MKELSKTHEIHFKGKAMLDGGTEIGLKIQLEARNVF